MEMDLIRIETLANGKRIGTLVSADYESKIDSDGNDNNDYQNSIVYNMPNRDVSLDDIENLEDGDYKIELFEPVYIAASFVSEGAPLPTVRSQKCYRYIITEDQ
jgi:hypothetical protein